MNWSDGAASLLQELWPNYSASAIAGRLGTTRNAVIGKANRMGLPTKSSGFRSIGWTPPAPRRTPANGSRSTRRNALAAMVYFDEETFGQIRARAVRLNTSFSEQVRQLVEWGLLDADEAAA